MYEIFASTKFKKDLKTIIKRGYDSALLDMVVTELALGNQLDKRYLDHALMGKYSGCRECHISGLVVGL